MNRLVRSIDGLLDLGSTYREASHYGKITFVFTWGGDQIDRCLLAIFGTKLGLRAAVREHMREDKDLKPYWFQET